MLIDHSSHRGSETSACWESHHVLLRAQADKQKTETRVLFLSYRGLEHLNLVEFLLQRSPGGSELVAFTSAQLWHQHRY